MLGGTGHVEATARPGPGIRKAHPGGSGPSKVGPGETGSITTSPLRPAAGAPTRPAAVVLPVLVRILQP